MGGMMSRTTAPPSAADGDEYAGIPVAREPAFRVPSGEVFAPHRAVTVARGDGTVFAFEHGVKVVVVVVPESEEARANTTFVALVEKMAAAGLFGSVVVEVVEVVGGAQLTKWALRHPLLICSPDVAFVLDGVHNSWLAHKNAGNVYITFQTPWAGCYDSRRTAPTGMLWGSDDGVQMMRAFVSYEAPGGAVGLVPHRGDQEPGAGGDDWMAELPDEMLLEIFGWLPAVDAVRVQRVCARWARVAADASLFRTLVLRDQVAAGGGATRMPATVLLATLLTAPSVRRGVQTLDVSLTDVELTVLVALGELEMPALETLVGIRVHSSTCTHRALQPLMEKGVTVTVAGYVDPRVMWLVDEPNVTYTQYSSLAPGALVDVDGTIKFVASSMRIERGQHPQAVIGTIDMMCGATDLNTIVRAVEPEDATAPSRPAVLLGRLGTTARVLEATVIACTVAAISAEHQRATLTIAEGRSFAMNCTLDALGDLAVGSPVDVYQWRGIRFGLTARTADAVAAIDNGLRTSPVFSTLLA